MADIVDRLRNRAKRCFPDGSAGALLDADAVAEIERYRDMCIRREEFIAHQGLWTEFSKWLSEPDADLQQQMPSEGK